MHHLSSRSFLIISVVSLGAAVMWVSPGYQSQAAGNTYYVATNGSDSNTCAQATSTATPKRNIMGTSGGIACLSAGDTLYIRQGTYTEAIRDNYQTIPRGTSWSNAVTIVSAPGEVATLNPNDESITLLAGAQYIIFDGLVLDGQRTSDFDGIGGAGAYHHIRFKNMTIKNWLRSGIFSSDEATDLEVLNSEIYNNGNSASYHGMYWTASNSLIDGNKIHDNASLGIQIQNAGSGGNPSGGAHRNTFRNNIVWGNLEQGLHLDGVDNVVYNNVLHSNGYGISISGCPATNRSLIYNNTIYGNASHGIDIGGYGCQADSNVIRNNITVDNAGSPINVYPQVTGTVFSNNLCSSSGTGCALTGSASAIFVNASSNDFHLQAGSPAIDAGVSISEVPTDFEGTPRPQGGAYDIGADEYGAGTGVSPSPSPTPCIFIP